MESTGVPAVPANLRDVAAHVAESLAPSLAAWTKTDIKYRLEPSP
jgi:hypothetical protein